MAAQVKDGGWTGEGMWSLLRTSQTCFSPALVQGWVATVLTGRWFM
jgi:hypothetical protein